MLVLLLCGVPLWFGTRSTEASGAPWKKNKVLLRSVLNELLVAQFAKNKHTNTRSLLFFLIFTDGEETAQMCKDLTNLQGFIPPVRAGQCVLGAK